MKKDILTPIAVLTGICLLIAALLAVTNAVTSPIIAAAAAQRAEAARMEALPAADGFEELEIRDLPASVSQVYRATNNAGFVFMLAVNGYGGRMELICGIGRDGTITSCKTLSHKETAGLGAKTAEDSYRSQYIGAGEDLSGIEAVSGATISSKAYSSAIADAFAAYNMVKGG